MKEKEKKKQGQRGKTKPIVDVDEISLEEKLKTVDYLVSQLPNDLKGEMELLSKEEREKEKEQEKEQKNLGGRPTKFGSYTIQKLKICFSAGLTVRQSCYSCGISKSAFYYYVRDNPGFLDEINILRESITMQARVNVGRSIKNGNVGDSWKRLSLKDPQFIPKFVFKGEINMTMTEEDQVMYDKILLNNKQLLSGNKETES